MVLLIVVQNRARAGHRRAYYVWSARPLTVLAYAALVAIALSAQYFFQPFVWRYWPIDRVFLGWIGVAIDHLVLVEPVALVLIAVGWIRVRDEKHRIFLLAIAITLGALMGDLLERAYVGANLDPATFLQQSLRLALVGASVLAMFAIWRIGATSAATAASLRAQGAAARAAADLNELEALRRQIEPHFLFNTLATIRQLQQSDDNTAGQHLLARLLAYIQQSLAVAGASRARLQDEVALVESYLAICQSRMADRLVFRIEAPESLANAEVPPLLLITLVENAVIHGLAPSPGGGCISVIARREEQMLELLICDDGVGLGKAGSGHGIGLSNTLRRLRLSFGASASLSVYANQPNGTCAHVRLPLEVAA